MKVHKLEVKLNSLSKTIYEVSDDSYQVKVGVNTKTQVRDIDSVRSMMFKCKLS
jgi:hypothetical protein